MTKEDADKTPGFFCKEIWRSAEEVSWKRKQDNIVLKANMDQIISKAN